MKKNLFPQIFLAWIGLWSLLVFGCTGGGIPGDGGPGSQLGVGGPVGGATQEKGDDQYTPELPEVALGPGVTEGGEDDDRPVAARVVGRITAQCQNAAQRTVAKQVRGYLQCRFVDKPETEEPWQDCGHRRALRILDSGNSNYIDVILDMVDGHKGGFSVVFTFHLPPAVVFFPSFPSAFSFGKLVSIPNLGPRTAGPTPEMFLTEFNSSVLTSMPYQSSPPDPLAPSGSLVFYVHYGMPGEGDRPWGVQQTCPDPGYFGALPCALWPVINGLGLPPLVPPDGDAVPDPTPLPECG